MSPRLTFFSSNAANIIIFSKYKNVKTNEMNHPKNNSRHSFHQVFNFIKNLRFKNR